MRRNLLLRIVFILLTFSLSPAQALTIEADGPEQAPLIYVHGYIDDGTSWARDSLYEVEDKLSPMSIKYLRHYVFGPDRSPSAFFTRNGIENWAVQWWAEDGFNTNSTAKEGYAFLQDSQELLDGTNWVMGTWTAQNRPIPSALEILTAAEIDMALGLSPIPSSILGLPTSLLVKAGIASQLWINSTYQDAGRVDPRAEDFLELIRSERRQQGKLSRYRQVNIITHSMGSLVTRAMLDKAHTASIQDSESIANVVYNAPPFAGSTMAYLSKIYFEPVQLNSTIFEDERVQLMLSTSATTAKDLLVNYLNLLIRPLGVVYEDIESGFDQTTREVIDLLFLIPINDIVDPQFINSLSGTLTGDSIVAAMQFARPFVAGLLGVKGNPGHDDLTPEGGLAHVTGYDNNPDVKQFVTLGIRGLGLHLFPDDLDAVANNPSLITDNSVQTAQDDDTAVAEGSARLLTTTDNFGPRMSLLQEFDLEHPDMLYRNLPEMGPVWLETLLAPTTDMEVTGDIEVINSEARSYLIKAQGASLSFVSTNIQRTLDFPVSEFLPFGQSVDIFISAQAHEYRLVSDDGSSIIQDWSTLTNGSTLSFDNLENTNDLQDTPFYIEWRSINQRGGREMIRSARFVVAGAAPQVIDSNILGGQPSQILRTSRTALMGSNAVRGRVFEQLLDNPASTFLNTIKALPEANWVISQAGNKALTLVFDKPARLNWAWEDSQLQNPQTVDNVSGHLIELDGLDEGVHTLYFRTANPLSPQVTSPIQQLRIQVDNTAPLVNFELTENHPLGVVVGPATPLSFSIQDVGSNSATGELVVAANADWSFPSDRLFSLQQTGLKQQMESSLIVGGFVELEIASEDQVGNKQTETRTVYFDITEPEISLLELTPAVQITAGEYQLLTQQVDIVIDVSDSGSGILDRQPVLVISGEHEGFQFSEALTLGGVGGYPDKFGATVSLPYGRNRLAVAISDFAGNIGSLGLIVERIDPVIQDANLDIISPRLDSNSCFNASGDVINCTGGSIDEFTSSFNGEMVSFSSSGNRFVRGDNNRSKDIFVWSGEGLKIVSRNDAGELANDDSQRPVVSGNGRYVFFEGSADNLVNGAKDFNLYVKELGSERIAVISRAPDGSPINLSLQGNFYPTTTFSGRYVFFSSRNTTYLNEFKNPGTQIYMVDLDPDENGDFFDDNYVTHPVSNINSTTMPANASEYPKVTQDGRYLVYNSRTDGALRLMRFTGSDENGDLDVSSRSETLIANGGGSVFNISPYGDDVVFMTRNNLLPVDNNQALIDADIYLSRGEASGAGFFSRDLELVSYSFQGLSSSMDAAFPIQDVSIAQDNLAPGSPLKVSWVSSHDNIVPDDNNGTEDLFIARDSTVFPVGLDVTNWVSELLPANVHVLSGSLSPDGRYAFWVTQQKYAAPYETDGFSHIFRRRIDPAQSYSLTVQTQGDGQVNISPDGTEISPGVFQFDGEENVTITALADEGSVLLEWQNDLTGSDIGQSIRITENLDVTAIFERLPGPVSASAQITLEQGHESAGVEPAINYLGEPVFSIEIVSQPDNGLAFTRAGMLYYRADKNFSGTDSFEFQVSNSQGAMLPVAAIALVEVTPLNRPPVSAELIIETALNQMSSALTPNVDDPDLLETFTFELVSDPVNGRVDLQGDAFVYTPDQDYEGDDSFSYKVIDSSGNTIVSVALVTVTASKVEDSGGSGGGGSFASILQWFLFLWLLRYAFVVKFRNNLNS